MSRRPPSRLKLFAGAAEAGTPLWKLLVDRGGLSEEAARAAIERGAAFVEEVRERDPQKPVPSGARIEVLLRERGALPPPPPPLEESRIVHLDDDVIAVDKPAGVLAQEGRSGGLALPDLVAALLAKKFARRDRQQALLVHRLDRGTTGVTILARSREAQAALLAEFREGRVKKEYRALVAGVPQGETGEIDLALGEDPAAPGKRRPDPKGEPARTRWLLLERYEFGAAGSLQPEARSLKPSCFASLIAAFPETGRTHQVRVHLASIGLPLLGDARYGGPKSLTRPDGTRLELERPLLHALRVGLRAPGGGALDLQAPLPADFVQACALLR